MTGRQTTRTRQKYKDSCTHCANAKVKCSKEKPRCVRCSEKGLTCSYDLSHRYGRLPAYAKLKYSTNLDPMASAASSAHRPIVHTSPAPPSPAPESTDLHFAWLDDSSAAMALGSVPAALGGHFDFDYNAAVSQSLLPPAFTATSITPWQQQTLQTTMAPALNTMPVTDAVPGNLNYAQDIDGGYELNSQQYHSRSASSVSSLPCTFENPAAAFTSTPPITFSTPPETPDQRVISHSIPRTYHDCLPHSSAILIGLRRSCEEALPRETMDQISQIVDCDCFARDDHLRLLVALIGFEVMAKYARSTRNGAGRTSAEVVVQELQAVLKLIERLLKRLRAAEPTSRGTSPISDTYSNPPAISPLVFGQLEADLRRHLRGISHETMDILRRV